MFLAFIWTNRRSAVSKSIALLLFSVAGIWGLFLLTIGPALGASAKEKLFHFRLPFEPATLDWTLGDVPIWVTQNSMRGLYRVDEQGKVVPDLLRKASQRSGGKAWRLELQSGIHWSDGIPLTAQHAADGLRRLLDPATASSYSYFLSGLTPAAIKASGELVLEIELPKPLPALPAILTHWVTFPVRQDLIARWKDYGNNPKHMAFLGPYRIESWDHSSQIVLVPMGATKGFDRVEAKIIPDDNTALNLFDTGQLDLLTDPGELTRARPELASKPSPISYFIGVGATHPLTSKPEGILALSLALDREQIPQALNAPHRPASRYCPPEICVWEPGFMHPPGDRRERARKLLKAAGFGPGAVMPPLTLRYFNRPAIRLLAEWIQSQWKSVLGLQVQLDGQDPKTYWSQLGKTPAALFINSKGASYPDADAFFSLFTSPSAQNLGRWNDKEYDRWIAQAASTQSQKERVSLYQRAEKRLIEERPGLIPLYFRATQVLIKPGIRGLVINPLTSLDLRAATRD